MSVRYSYDNFSTKGHGVIETCLTSHSDEYVLYEIENEIPAGFRLMAKTRKLTGYIKNPNHSIAYGRKKQQLSRMAQIKSQLSQGKIIRADNNIIKQTSDGLFEVYQLHHKTKKLTVLKQKPDQSIVNKPKKYKQVYDEIYRHLLTIQENAKQNRDH